MKYFWVFCFGFDDFISVYADSFIVKTSPNTDNVLVWFETSDDYAACFPLSMVHQIYECGSSLDRQLVFENVHRLDGYHYKIFE